MNLIAKADITDELINPAVVTADLTAADTYFDDIAASLDVDITTMSRDVAGYVTGGVGVAEVMSTWQAVTAGSFAITINGVAANITALNLSAAANVTEVAAIIQTALRAVGTGGYLAATTTYNTTDKYFIISSGTTGTLSSVSALSAAPSGTDISGAGFMKCHSAAATVTAGASLPYKVKELLKAFVCQRICENKASSAGSSFQNQNDKDKWGAKLPIYTRKVQLYESQMTETVILGTSTATASIGVITIERG